jgi:hypothetical protein
MGIESSRHQGYRVWLMADDSMRNVRSTPGEVRISVCRFLQIKSSKSV